MLSCHGKAEAQNWTPLLPVEAELDSLLYASTMFDPAEYMRKLNEGMPGTLIDDDYREVAEMLGVEVAAIKAVVDIETGRIHEGFYAPGKPILYLDLNMYRKAARRYGVDLQAARQKSPEIFQKPNIKKYGSKQLAEQARVDQAVAIHEESGLEGAFWGMFQIGGFNWKLCGTNSVQEFVALMSRSERDQLEMFARFCKARNLVRFIKKKDWAGFSLRYNGPGYAKIGYHTMMARAYNKFKAQGY